MIGNLVSDDWTAVLEGVKTSLFYVVVQPNWLGYALQMRFMWVQVPPMTQNSNFGGEENMPEYKTWKKYEWMMIIGTGIIVFFNIANFVLNLVARL